jgi:hypothetical protein
VVGCDRARSHRLGGAVNPGVLPVGCDVGTRVVTPARASEPGPVRTSYIIGFDGKRRKYVVIMRTEQEVFLSDDGKLVDRFIETARKEGVHAE